MQGGVALSGHGTILSSSNLGDTAGALATLGKAQEIREDIARLQPSSAKAQQDLAYCYAATGFIYLLNGPPDKAVAFQKKAVVLLEALVIKMGSDEDFQYKLWNVYMGLAKALGNPAVPNLGDTTSAMAYMDKAWLVIDALVTAHPDSLAYQQGLGAFYNASGHMLSGIGKRQEALDEFKKALGIDEKVVERAPANTQYRRELAVQCGTVGGTLLELGDRAGAQARFEQAIQLYESMMAADPNDVPNMRNCAVGYRNLGGALEGDHPEAAMSNYRRALSMFAQLVARDAGNADFGRQQAYTYLMIGKLQRSSNDSGAAIGSFNDGIAIVESILSASPANVSARRTLASLYNELGETYQRNSQARDARDAWEKSLAAYAVLKTKGSLSATDATQPAELARKIAECDQALAAASH